MHGKEAFGHRASFRHFEALQGMPPLSAMELVVQTRQAPDQNPAALLSHNVQWMRLQGCTLTHIFLWLPLGLVGHRQANFSSSVENESLWMNLPAAFGLPVARTEIIRFDSQKVLSMERFDRHLHSSGECCSHATDAGGLLPGEGLALTPEIGRRRRSRRGGRCPVLQGSVQAERHLSTLLTS